MSDISIVTAFFDIGRGSWTPDKGLPHYLERSAETYIERFSYLAQLDNEITVVTSSDLVDKIRVHRKGKENKTNFIIFDPREEMAEVRKRIALVQKDPNFQKFVHPSQAKNPEYWNPDYVLVTNLKAYFVGLAIQNNYVSNDMVAWIDFGYCRDNSKIPNSKVWEYDFNPEKIHFFNYKEYDGKPIKQVVATNDVYILGAKVVAHKKLWPEMIRLMKRSHDELMADNFVDDDQGLWLMSYLMNPELFEMHRIPDHQYGHDPFVLFNNFNNKL